MIPIDIPEKNKTLYFPENLAECDADQYADMAKLLYLFSSGEIHYFDFRVLAVYALLGMKFPEKIPQVIPEDDVKWQNIFRLSELVDGFFHRNETEDGDKLEVKLDFMTNHYPTHKMFGTYVGPQDGFQDVCFGQYIDGLEEYIYFSQTGDIESLKTLFCIFYLPKNEKYSLKNAKKRAKGILKNTDIRHLYGFYLFFTAMQQYIIGGQITIMGNEIDLSIIYQELPEHQQEKSEIPGIGMYSVLYDLAESGVFGNYEGVRQTNMWMVFVRLYELKKKEIDQINREKKNESKRV